MLTASTDEHFIWMWCAVCSPLNGISLLQTAFAIQRSIHTKYTHIKPKCIKQRKTKCSEQWNTETLWTMNIYHLKNNLWNDSAFQQLTPQMFRNKGTMKHCYYLCWWNISEIKTTTEKKKLFIWCISHSQIIMNAS